MAMLTFLSFGTPQLLPAHFQGHAPQVKYRPSWPAVPKLSPEQFCLFLFRVCVCVCLFLFVFLGGEELWIVVALCFARIFLWEGGRNRRGCSGACKRHQSHSSSSGRLMFGVSGTNA